MERYQIVIIGAATAGSFFARKMAEKGKSVLVIDKCGKDTLGRRLDIFHMVKSEFAKYDLPLPVEGDKEWAFEFTDTCALSPSGNYPKATKTHVVGMHMAEYIACLNDWVSQVGAKFEYNAEFEDFIIEKGKIVGITYKNAVGESVSVGAELVADCSGIPAVARTRLPNGYGVENRPLTPSDMFYVILKYYKYLNAKDYLHGSRGWTYYKTWEAPQQDPHGAILGIGANFSFDYAEQIYTEFEKRVPLPERELQKIEKGFTPYCRPPYSFVADGFIAMGDAACLTKPFNGEGVTSSMVQGQIAVDVVNELLDNGKELSRANLWKINNEYIVKQGAKFAGMMATIIGAVGTSRTENEFFFKKDIVFSAKSFAAMDSAEGMTFTTGEIIDMAFKMLGGVIAGKLRMSTIKALLKSMDNSEKIKKLYLAFPTSPDGYEGWTKQADEQWTQIGSMSDNVNK